MSSDSAEDSWKPKAIVFDLLTALLDSWSIWDASVAESNKTTSTSTSKSTPTSNPSSTSTSTATAADGRRWRLRYLELTYTQGTYVPYESLVQQAASDVGLPSSAPAALLANWAHLPPWSDVPETLLSLRAKGYKLGVVTNCSKLLGDAAVRNLELAVQKSLAANEAGEGGQRPEFRFDAVVTAEESGWYKPVKEAYDAILPGLGVEREEVLFVAGSAGDVQGATDAGLKVVWHNQTGLERKGTAVAMWEGRSLGETVRDFL